MLRRYVCRPRRSCGKVMYTPLDQVHPPPRDQVHPPGTRYTPRDQVHPPVQSMLGDTVNAWAVRILLECNLVTPVILFTGGGCLLQCMLAYTHPQADTPPPVQTSPVQTPPDKHPPGETPPGKQPPCQVHAGIHTHPPAQCMLG